MNIWQILGIAPVNDVDAIKAAYRKKLAVTHPEEKPEEFQQLRDAYEQALKLAKQAESNDTAAKTPMEAWTAEMKAIYYDFSRRINPEEWTALLAQEVSFSLASRPQAEEALMRFLMDEYYLPHNVWLVLDEFFDLSGRREQLAETYPEAFLRQVVFSGIGSTDYVRYEYFNECHGTEPDDYLHQFFKTERLLRENQLEEGIAELAVLKAMPAKHPFENLLQCRVLLRQDKDAEAFELAKETLALHPDNDTLLLIAADSARFAGQHTEAIPYYNQLVEMSDSKNNSALYGRAQSFEALGNWKEASDDFSTLVTRFPSDRELREKQQAIYQKWMESLEGEQAERTPRQTLDLVWAMLETGKYEEGLALVLSMQTDNIGDEYEKQNSAGNLCMALGRFEDALAYAKGWEACIRAIPEDTEDETLKRYITRLPRSFEMQANALRALERNDEAIALMEKALALNATEARTWIALAGWHLQDKKFEEAQQCAQKVQEILPGDSTGFYLAGIAQFEQMDLNEAYESFDTAIGRDGTNLSYYSYQARILIARDKKDECRKLLDFLAERGAQGDTLTCLNLRWEQTFGDEAQQKRASKDLSEMAQRVDLQMDIYDVLFYGASLDEDLSQEQQKAFCAAGLEHRSNDIELMGRYVWLCNELKEYDEAIRVGEETLAFYPYSTNQKYRLAFAYLRVGQYEKGATLYEQNGERENDAEDFYLAGRNFYYAEQKERAKQDLLRSIEMDAANPYAYRFLSLLLRDEGNQEEAIAAAKKAIEVDEKEDRVRYHWRHLGQLCQHFGLVEQAFDARLKYAIAEDDLADFAAADQVYENAQLWNKAFTARRQYFRTHNTAEDKNQYWVEHCMLMIRQNRLAEAGNALKKLLFAQKSDRVPLVSAQYYLAEGKTRQAYNAWRKIPQDSTSRQRTIFFWMLRDMGKSLELTDSLKRKSDDISTWGPNGMGEPGETLLSYACRLSIAMFSGDTAKVAEIKAEQPAMTLCEHCGYATCRDVEELDAHQLELDGKFAEALAMWQKMYRLDAGDEDIVINIMRLRRKMAAAQ